MKKLLIIILFICPYLVAEQQPRFNTLEERFVDVKIKRRKITRELSEIRDLWSSCDSNSKRKLCDWLRKKIDELEKIVANLDDEIIEFESAQKNKK